MFILIPYLLLYVGVLTIIIIKVIRKEKVHFLSYVLLILLTLLPFASLYIKPSIKTTTTTTFSQTKSNPVLPKFSILIETTDDGIKLTGLKGCAFKELTFRIREYQSQAIDQNGMSSLKDSIQANFMFTIKKTHEGLSFEKIKGTSWKTCDYGYSGRAHVFIDQNGIGSKEEE